MSVSPTEITATQRIRYEASKASCRALNDAGLPFSITAGCFGTVESQGRDLDLLLTRSDVRKAAACVESELKKLSWDVRSVERGNGHVWLFAKHPSEDVVAEVDFAHTLRWGPLVFCKKPVAEVAGSEFRFDPWAVFVKQVLLSALTGNCEKASSRFTNLAWLCRPSLIEDRLQLAFGQEMAALFIQEIQDGSLSRALVHRMRLKAWTRGLANVSTVPTALTSAWGELLAKLPTQKRIAPTIAIIGPDGVGKSTMIDILKSEISLSLPYTKICLKHWRPGLLPLLGFWKRSTIPSSQGIPPRRHIGRFSSLRLLYYTLDYIAGSFLIDRKASAFNSLIIYDRHYVDFILDPVRFGIAPGRLQAFLIRFIRKPELVVALTDEPAAIHGRKPELTVDEIRSIYSKIEELAELGYIDEQFPVRDSVCSSGEALWTLLKPILIRTAVKQP